MLLGYSLTPFGHHPDAWRHAHDGENLLFGSLLDQVEAAEAGGLDFVLLSDSLGLRPADDLSSVAVPFEPTLLASSLAARARRIGFVMAASIAQHEPYNLARRFASVDLISGGRAGWLVIPSGSDPGRDDEYLDVVKALWDSFEDDAFLYDKASGRFFDPAKMHVANHKGANLSVRGPLNVNRSPQGRPVLAHIVADGIDLRNVSTSELIFLQSYNAEAMIELARKTVAAVDKSGRQRSAVKVIANIAPFVSGAGNEASATAGYELDMQAQPSAAVPIVGTPGMIAERMQELEALAGIDGFTVLPPTLAAGTHFVDAVVPELVARRMLANRPEETLRARLSLALPIHPATLHEEVSP